ncbi:MAG: 5'/3'-nucleotidase SurE [Calothrix sp. MO_167.B42]|nr:5'/3'-nucleotidase SurE [Calothrix sp. MO_167.B42]
MNLILTNDDGIDAPGIQALQQAVNALSNPILDSIPGEQLKNPKSQKIIIAAPQDHQSGCGHQVTTHRPIQVQQRSQFAYAIAGTPADCVRIAVSHLCEDINWVISGINAGGNLGVDAYISGTVAAVREAAMHGIPAIAISHYRKGKLNYNWDLAAKWTARIIADLFNHPQETGTYWNINLPHVQPGDKEPEVVFCQPCTKPLPVNYQIKGDKFYYAGEYGKRERTPGSDVDVCFSGNIAITKLQL